SGPAVYRRAWRCAPGLTERRSLEPRAGEARAVEAPAVPVRPHLGIRRRAATVGGGRGGDGRLPWASRCVVARDLETRHLAARSPRRARGHCPPPHICLVSPRHARRTLEERPRGVASGS